MTPERFHHLREVLARRQVTLTVLMENVHKPHNYSAVLRSCDAVGIHRAHAISSQAVVSTAKMHSSSASAAKWVQVTVHGDIHEACASLHAEGFSIFAAHLGADARDYRTVDYTQPVAILLGAEKDGVTPEALEHVDGCIHIPMQGMVQSLNVSVANAVVLFEAQRQRVQAGMYARGGLSEAELTAQLFEWAYPRIAELCRRRRAPYPELDSDGRIVGPVPR
mgnify:CR=1 FL=1